MEYHASCTYLTVEAHKVGRTVLKSQLAGWRRVPAEDLVPDLGAPTCDRAHQGVSMIRTRRRKVSDERKQISFPELA